MNKELNMLKTPDDKNIEDRRSALKATIFNKAQNMILTENRNHQDWFD